MVAMFEEDFDSNDDMQKTMMEKFKLSDKTHTRNTFHVFNHSTRSVLDATTTPTTAHRQDLTRDESVSGSSDGNDDDGNSPSYTLESSTSGSTIGFTHVSPSLLVKSHLFVGHFSLYYMY